MSPTLASVLSQDRKFGVALTLAFQYLAQVEDLINAIKGNTTSRISFQVGEEDAALLAPLFTSSSDPEEVRDRSSDLMNLERYQGFLKTSVEGKPIPPTTFVLSKPLKPMHWENMEHVVHNTRRDLCLAPSERADSETDSPKEEYAGDAFE
ncbi:MAG: hypothetical protein JW738_05030 [Actinobacteria bacterium]|nr:hypothetical protein [Actinomycetota bacterium]